MKTEIKANSASLIRLKNRLRDLEARLQIIEGADENLTREITELKETSALLERLSTTLQEPTIGSGDSLKYIMQDFTKAAVEYDYEVLAERIEDLFRALLREELAKLLH